jgi:hypothetical protein
MVMVGLSLLIKFDAFNYNFIGVNNYKMSS